MLQRARAFVAGCFESVPAGDVTHADGRGLAMDVYLPYTKEPEIKFVQGFGMRRPPRIFRPTKGEGSST